MLEERRGPPPPPHGVIFAVAVTALVFGQVFLGDGQAITEVIAETLSPVAVILLPITLIVIIQLLSSRGSWLSDLFGCSRDSIHLLVGSPAGAALLLLLVVFLVYNRSSFIGGDDSDE